jgi:DNA-binding MarR family transcriptional regulator
VALRRIMRAIDLRSRTLLQDYGLTAPQLTALHAISRLEPVTASVLAQNIHLGQPTVTGIVTRLERRGLIERNRGVRDRRSVNISLTEEGERVLRHAPSLLQDQFLQRLGGLKEWERTQILATLQRIAEMMDAGAIEAAPVLSSELVDATAHAPLHFEEMETPEGAPPERQPDSGKQDKRRGPASEGRLEST